MPLLVFIFMIKLLARTNVFNSLREKHGLDTLRGVRKYERLLKRQAKLKLDLTFLLTCKKERLIPNFASPKFSIKTNPKTTRKIGRMIVETEIGNKHRMRNKIKEQIRQSNDFLATKMSFLEHKAVQSLEHKAVQSLEMFQQGKNLQ